MITSSQKTTFIYGLWDPRDYQLRYIGKTKDAPQKRLKAHIQEAKFGGNNHKNNWIKQLLLEGLEPSLEILEECTDETWEQSEKDWIAECKNFGLNLVNITNGGEGGIGELVKGKPSHRKGKKLLITHILKIKSAMQQRVGQPRPEEVRKKISDSHKGKTLGEETKRKIGLSSKGRNVGLKRSEETKRKMSEAQLGQKNHRYGKHLTEAQKEAIRKVNLGRKHTEESIRKISDAKKGKNRSEETKRKISETRKRIFSEKKEKDV